MASNPYFSPYHTQRFSFIGSPQQRDGTYTKDQRFLNMYPELIKSPMTDGKKYYLKKRPGVAGGFQLPAGIGQGIYFWQGSYYTAVAGTLYANSVPLITLTQGTSTVGFCEWRTDADDRLLIFDGTKGWAIGAGNTVGLINGIPSPHIPAPVFMDGYIFLAATGSQTIHNSAVSDFGTWPSDGFIDAEMYPDNIQTLTISNNYIVAVGTNSVEFFYDNANATGSPLQRNAPAVAQFGTPAPLSVNQTEKETILVGSTGNGGRTVWIITGFQPTEIASEPVREALDLEGTLISGAYASTIQCAGHKWYILSLISANRTFVYDFDEQMWHEWTTGPNQEKWDYPFSTDGGTGGPSFLHINNGSVSTMGPSNYQDQGLTINCVVITSKIDFDSSERKRFFRLTMVGDSPNGDANTPMTIDWSDDDYNTWAGNRTIQLNGVYPTTTQLGYSRRRAFRFTYQQPYPLRLESFELDIIQEVRR
jgi:hypothetical protein